MNNQIHTMKNKSNGTWYNKQDDAKRASNAGFATQKEAVNSARSIAINQRLEHSIHRADNNQIRERIAMETMIFHLEDNQRRGK